MRDSELSRVVLPEPVPPEMMIFKRQRAAISNALPSCGERVPLVIKLEKSIILFENLRMDIHGPLRLSGGMITFTPTCRPPILRLAWDLLYRSASNRRRDALRHVQDVRIATELRLCQLQLAVPLHIDHSRPIDEDIGYGGVV